VQLVFCEAGRNRKSEVLRSTGKSHKFQQQRVISTDTMSEEIEVLNDEINQICGEVEGKLKYVNTRAIMF